jgi:uncharacterized protein (TIGR03437 family)
MVANLPAGTVFGLCAYPVEPNQMASCAWTDFGETGDPGNVRLSNGESITDIRLILRTNGVLLKFEIDDPGNFIDRGVYFKFSVRSSPGSLVAPIQMEHGNPVVFATAVPPGVSTQIFLITPLVIYDETGESLPMERLTHPISVGSGDTVVQLRAVANIVNAASYWPALPTGGGIASLFAPSITNVQGIVTADTIPLPKELAGTSVSVGGLPAPIFAVANVGGQEQINFQVTGGHFSGSGEVVVNNNGLEKRFHSLHIITPGIFFNADQPAIQHASDFSLVSSENPALRGEAIVIYATGLYLATPVCTLTPLVRIADNDAKLLFCGRAPGFVGLDQLNVQVPEDTPSGLAELVIIQNGVPSNVVLLPVE